MAWPARARCSNPRAQDLAAEMMEVFGARNVHREAAAALVLFLRTCENEWTAAELIWRLGTLLQRKIRPGTVQNFLERARIFFDGSKLSGAAQNLSRPLQTFWIRPETFSTVPWDFGSGQKLLEPFQASWSRPKIFWPATKNSGRSPSLRTRPESFRAVPDVPDRSKNPGSRSGEFRTVEDLPGRSRKLPGRPAFQRSVQNFRLGCEVLRRGPEFSGNVAVRRDRAARSLSVA